MHQLFGLARAPRISRNSVGPLRRRCFRVLLSSPDVDGSMSLSICRDAKSSAFDAASKLRRCDFYLGPQIVFGPLMAGHIRSSNSRRRHQAYKRIIKKTPRKPGSKTAAATKRLKASSSSPIKYKPLEVDPWICGNAL